MRFAIVFALLALATARPTKRYDGYRVIKITPETEEELNLLRSWKDQFDFTLEPVAVGREAHLMLSPQHMSYVRAKLLANGISFATHIADVQKRIDENFDEIEARRASRPDQFAFDYNNFNTFEDYLLEYDALVATCPAGFSCRTHDIGTTIEGRPMRTLQLTHNSPTAGRTSIWYDSMIHAREWLAGATLMKVIERIFRGTDAEAARFRNYDWYFLPQMNPDGYVHSHTTDRYWRKNRRPNEGAPNLPQCTHGVDLNRNYDHNWSAPGASADPCSDTYHGPSPASELETQAVDGYAAQITGAHPHPVITWINFHTYGQYWLTPWGDCTVPSDHNSHQMPVANAACNAIEATYGTNWQCGNSCQILYETSGGIIDRMKAAHGITWAHTPELRGPDFVVPPSAIEPSYTEVWNGLVAKLTAMEATMAKKH